MPVITSYHQTGGKKIALQEKVRDKIRVTGEVRGRGGGMEEMVILAITTTLYTRQKASREGRPTASRGAAVGEGGEGQRRRWGAQGDNSVRSAVEGSG